MLKTVSSFINNIGALVYKGTWNASSNVPTLASGVGNKGDYYYVSVAGNTNLDGITDWQVGDFAVFNGSVWQKIDNTDAVLSVNGQTGVVVLVATDVGATPNTAYVNVSGGLLTGGGRLTGNVTINLENIPVANVTNAVPDSRTVSATGLLSGGGALSSNVTISLTSVPIANVAGAVPNTTTVSAGGLLTGGGNLASNITITLNNVPSANVTGLGTIAVQNANAVVITGGTTNNVTQTNVTISSGNATLNNVTAGNVNITYRGTSSNTGALNVGGAMSNPDIGIISSFVGNGSTYSYVAIQNTNNSSTAYASISAINDGFTAYSDMGVNSSNYSFSASGFPNNAVSEPNASFFVGYNGNVAIATWNANSVHFLANASASTSSAMVINGNNSVTINSLGQATSATATFATSSLPLVPAGYLQFTLANSTVVKVPYYAN